MRSTRCIAAPARPDYAVPGMLWINDVGGPTNWVVNVYLGPSVGDRPILQINTTTGAIASVADQITAAILLGAGRRQPGVRVERHRQRRRTRSYGGPCCCPRACWSFRRSPTRGAVQAGIDFNRDGTVRVVAPAADRQSELVPDDRVGEGERERRRRGDADLRRDERLPVGRRHRRQPRRC